MFEIQVTTHFSAAHHLVAYPGDCAQVHGHNWQVSVFVQAEHLNQIGIAVDFRDVKQAVAEVVDNLDHRDLNAQPAFQQINPTSEVIARYIYQQLSTRINDAGVRVARVTVSEAPASSASYFE